MEIDSVLKSLRTLRNQYFQNVPVKELKWPSSQVLKKWDVQNFLFEELFGKHAFTSAHPSEDYQLRFLKHLMALVESGVGEDDVRHDLL